MKSKRPYNKKRRRIGRGIGSGCGKTSGRGHKGQGARSGCSIKAGFEGGQNPLYRRLPKRGFNNAAFRTTYAIVNLEQIAGLGLAEVDPGILAERGVVRAKRSGLKVLGDGNLSQAVTVHAHRFSVSAKEKIEKAGGKAVVIGA
ncbi:MAG: 50S ribosomal protein L15 [Candidatus Omnitrophota bacterium]